MLTGFLIALSVLAYLIAGFLTTFFFADDDEAIVFIWFWFWPFVLLCGGPSFLVKATRKAIQERRDLKNFGGVKDARKQGNLSYPKQG